MRPVSLLLARGADADEGPSFARRQDRIDHGVLIRWTKGFGAPGAEGEDCAALFKKGLEKYVRRAALSPCRRLVSLETDPLTWMIPLRLQNVPVKLVALINDTTGTLIASAYVEQATRVGVIFGTGCNAAYMERVGNIPKIKDLGLPEDALVRPSLSLHGL